MFTRYDYQTRDAVLGGKELVYDEDIAYTMVPMSQHEGPADAVYDIMQQLYNSANAIDIEKMQKDFSYLCEYYGLTKHLIEHKDDLCVVHWKDSV